jgi:predicted esterase
MVLHVNGGFHSEYWDGTVRQLLLRKPDAKVLTVAIDPSNNPSTDGADGIGGAPRADFVVFAEARAKDIDDGAYAVGIGRELAYRLYVPKGATAPLPLLVWLGDDGLSARETLAEWKERLGDAAAIAVVEPPYRETQEDLLEGGRWFWPDSFAEDVFALREGFERLSGYLLRNQPIDPARVVLAGEGTGATVAAATALLSEQLDLRTLAFAPRRFAKIKDFPLPLPELFGDAERAAKSLALYASAGDEDWWRGELAEYTAIGFANELASVETDPWRGDLARENAVRRALGVAAVEPKADAARRFIVAKSPRERAWARRWVVRQRRDAGETVAVLAAAPTDGSATELETPVRASDFAAGRPLPRCPGPFGGTTVIVLPSGLVGEQVAAWRALEQDDPLAKKSRFHRLRVAHADGPQGARGAARRALRRRPQERLDRARGVLRRRGDDARARERRARERGSHDDPVAAGPRRARRGLTRAVSRAQRARAHSRARVRARRAPGASCAPPHRRTERRRGRRGSATRARRHRAALPRA